MGRLYRNGRMSRAMILEEARKIFNNRGLTIGVETLAQEMGLSRGRITHFFPAKDTVLVGIMQDYEHRMGELLQDFDWNSGTIFEQHFKVLDIIMDLQYEFRCIFVFLAAQNRSSLQLSQAIEVSYLGRIDGMHMRIKTMVESKLLEPRILEKEQLNIFLFQYTTVLTHWVVSHEIFHSRSKYQDMKPVYIKGALYLFLPFLTKKGKILFHEAEQAFVRKPISKNSRPAAKGSRR